MTPTVVIVEHAQRTDWPAIIAAVTSGMAAVIGVRNHRKVSSIDKAVNGTLPHENTLRENVESINRAVNGAAPGDDSIRENVQTLVSRKDMDPDA